MRDPAQAKGPQHTLDRYGQRIRGQPMTVLSLSWQLVRGQKLSGWVKVENYSSSPVAAHKTRHQSPEAPTPPSKVPIWLCTVKICLIHLWSWPALIFNWFWYGLHTCVKVANYNALDHAWTLVYAGLTHLSILYLEQPTVGVVEWFGTHHPNERTRVQVTPTASILSLRGETKIRLVMLPLVEVQVVCLTYA